MASRTMTLHCDGTIKDILCEAIRDYAYAAYPEGGSECAQVARYTLLELAGSIDTGVTADNPAVEVSKRPRAMVRAAIQYYFDRMDSAQGCSSAEQRKLFDVLLSGEPVNGAQLDRAALVDKTA